MQTQKIIFRDDDIAFNYTAHAGSVIMQQEQIFSKFYNVDKLFKKYDVTHTVAIIAHEIEQADLLVEYMRDSNHIDIQLHCWKHVHYPQHLKNFEYDIRFGKAKLEDIFGREVTTFYPPYNDVCQEMIDICKTIGIEISYDKMSLSGYLKGQTKEVVNFHYWADECIDLEPALKKYTGK